MSIEEVCSDLAEELVRHDYCEIWCHHDADGIAAGAIMGLSLFRAKKRFRIRVTDHVPVDTLTEGHPTLLCDLGSAVRDLPEDTMVVDHHIPRFSGPFHANPRFAGIDGDRELSAAGTAYIVAQQIGDNRDLAGLVMAGILGDGQQLAGKNREIYSEAIGNGIIDIKPGIRLAGRDYHEKMLLAAEPFLPGISGKEEEVSRLIDLCQNQEIMQTDEELLNSFIILSAASVAPAEVLLTIYGDTYRIDREVCNDAHTLTMLIDSCGKTGNGSLAVATCMRSYHETQKGWEYAKKHRLALLSEMYRFGGNAPDNDIICFEAGERDQVSDLADCIVRTYRPQTPVLVYHKDDTGTAYVSMRCPEKMTTRCGEILHEVAGQCGGFGGGHDKRGGATIAAGQIDAFLHGIRETCAV
ncbi:MAG: DHH family phosphoesterase [Methanospirillaceae archaeon]|nr:DHH family phosphoesterase [Methanospirillaceae archaeon]